MKIVSLISRILLGVIFVVFGLNGFLHFIPMGAPPSGVAGKFFEALFLSKYLVAVFTVQLVGGVLLLANRYVPLALTILGPVIVNILLFHILMAPSGLPLAILVTILWFVVFFRINRHFSGLFVQQAGNI